MSFSKKNLRDYYILSKELKSNLLNDTSDIKSLILDASQNQYEKSINDIGKKLGLVQWDIDKLLKNMLPRFDVDDLNFYELQLLKLFIKTLRINKAI